MNLAVVHPVAMLLILFGSVLRSETVEIRNRRFTIPDGYELKLATTPGLTERPIVVDFDHDGNLYVAESSGTNDNVQKQLKEKPHSILRLSDTDHDGVFDERTVFADRMMFPEGVLCHGGSVYVAAPPQIWKLTDTNDDGVADERKFWFDAKTLTGCANDLHGPYLGLDGWIYWCKGAFAEQTYALSSGDKLVTRAAHIFRSDPNRESAIEPVMTGGMDNPVEVVFTETGERIFNTTFFQHPANGQRDGLVHAIYGGVYGKSHGVLDGHPRTGPLMPVMTHLGAAAPSGLARLESNALGFKNHLLTACFNLHSITRHELIPVGSTFKTKDSVLVSSDNLDFHPTDVIEDADGSVLVVDTGGWYKLCCPTSQLQKPDVPGAIYRLTKPGAKSHTDPRGLNIDWNSTRAKVATLLADERFAVRKRSVEELGKGVGDTVPVLRRAVTQVDQRAARNAVWAACRIRTPNARKVVQLGLSHEHPSVRQAAAHAVSVARQDKTSNDRLIELLSDDSPHVQRAAAEAIGRAALSDAIPHLLDRLDKADIDRTLQHSLVYALIEIGASEKLLPIVTEGSAKQKLAALTALIGMREEHLLQQKDLLQLMSSRDGKLRRLATLVAKKHPQWSESFVKLYRREIQQSSERLSEFSPNIGALSGDPAIDSFIAELLIQDDLGAREKSVLLEQVPFAEGKIEKAFTALLQSGDALMASTVVRKLSASKKLTPALLSELSRISKSTASPPETRLLAARQLTELDQTLFAQVIGFLSNEQPARVRSLAVSVLENAKLNETQLRDLADSFGSVGAMELSRLLRVFEKSKSKSVGESLFTSLRDSPAATALPAEQLTSLAEQFGKDVRELARPLLAKTNADTATKAKRLAELLAALPDGDVRRGQSIFHDQKLACFTCHAIGYRGGSVGPDLSRIGRTRSRPDLLEAIVYPSASFVRSYEPTILITTDGRQWSGTIRDQSSERLELQLNATETKSIAADEIEEILPGKTSIMPSGLDTQLTKQQLADLVAFLESRK